MPEVWGAWPSCVRSLLALLLLSCGGSAVQDEREARWSRQSARADGRRPCTWGTDALLAKVGATVSARVDCGRFPQFFEPLDLDCLVQAAEQGASAEITFNWCVDCEIPITYVTTPEDGFLSLLMEEDYYAFDRQREARVESCSALAVDTAANWIECVDPILLYECQEPLLPR